jgi:hypothetical protein
MSPTEWWWLGLGLFGVVGVVLAVLLGLLIGVALRIERVAGNIWTVGKQIAGNTVSIWMLDGASKGLGRVERELQALERKVGEAHDGRAKPQAER